MRRAGRGPPGRAVPGGLPWPTTPVPPIWSSDLDVLIHEPDTGRVLAAGEPDCGRPPGGRLVVSGYERPLASAVADGPFHEPCRGPSSGGPRGRGVSAPPRAGDHHVLVLRPPRHRHPRDFGPATLAPLIGRHPDPVTGGRSASHGLADAGLLSRPRTPTVGVPGRRPAARGPARAGEPGRRRRGRRQPAGSLSEPTGLRRRHRRSLPGPSILATDAGLERMGLPRLRRGRLGPSLMELPPSDELPLAARSTGRTR